MAMCSNCKSNLSCGCQKRTASDGKSVCTKCQTSYEAKLKQTKTVETTSPTKAVWEKDRYNKS